MQASSPNFVVTTANTHYGRAISSTEHAQDFAGTDVLLLQEVLKTTPEETEKTLGELGLKLAAMDEEAGLAIAVSDRFNVDGSDSYEIQKRSRLANGIESMGFNPRLRKRSLLVAHLSDDDGNNIDVATGHPIVFARYFQRRKQIKATSSALVQSLPAGNLVYGSDGNHYPSPRKIDRRMASVSGLKDVTNDSPTVILKESKHSYLRWLGFKDARLDTLLNRGVQEVDSNVIKIKSDHRAIRANFRFDEKT